jgi:DNA-binding transcriptional MerR regulator
MNLFSIRDIENLTGIKAHTLRIWEQRYNLFCPKRRESNHRFYDCEDLKHLLRIAYLYNQGHKISQIACCSPEEMARLALEIKPDTDNYEIFINQLTEASIDLDQPRFDKILHNLVHHKRTIPIFKENRGFMAYRPGGTGTCPFCPFTHH